MGIPQVTEDGAVAAICKIAAGNNSAMGWTKAMMPVFVEEQPMLAQVLMASWDEMERRNGDGDIDPAVARMQSLHLAMLTYHLVKGAVESEQLESLFEPT